MSFIEFILDNKVALIVYAIVFFLIYINRKKFDVEGKVMFLYRTQFGIKAINNFAKKHGKLVRGSGYVAIVIGFIGMAFITYITVKGIYDLIFVPNAAPAVSLVIPGICLPGNPLCVPLGYGILALFIVVLIHEFGHGIVGAAHGIKIKNTGFGMLLFLPLAFVEPDEKQVVKKKSSVQQSIFAAGPFMNVVLAIIVIALSTWITAPLLSGMSEPAGVSFSSLQKDFPAYRDGIEKNMIYTHVNGVRITNYTDMQAELQKIKPYDTLVFTDENGKEVSVKTTVSPYNESMAYLGVKSIKDRYRPTDNTPLIGYHVLLFFESLLMWIFILSLGIGLANLLPLGPVDGGRMLNRAAIDKFGKKKGTKIWALISWIMLIMLVILLLFPYLSGLF